jgi:hypothetical protein
MDSATGPETVDLTPDAEDGFASPYDKSVDLTPDAEDGFAAFD